MLPNRSTIKIIKILPDHAIKWHGLGGAIAAHKTSWSSLCIVYLRVADCLVLQALAGAIEADGIRQRLIPRPMTKIARDLWSRELLLSLYRPIESAEEARLGGRPR